MGLLSSQSAKEVTEAQNNGSTLMAIWMTFLKALMSEFWENYRVLIYLGKKKKKMKWKCVRKKKGVAYESEKKT